MVANKMNQGNLEFKKLKDKLPYPVNALLEITELDLNLSEIALIQRMVVEYYHNRVISRSEKNEKKIREQELLRFLSKVIAYNCLYNEKRLKENGGQKTA